MRSTGPGCNRSPLLDRTIDQHAAGAAIKYPSTIV